MHAGIANRVNHGGNPAPGPVSPRLSSVAAALPVDQVQRLPASLAEAAAAFAASPLLRQALGEALHGSLVDSQAAELRRAAGLNPEALVASSAWWPLVGGPVG